MGKYVEDACRFLSQNKKTIRLAFRSGMKTKLAQIFLMWKIMFEGSNKNLDIHYFSYKEDLAGMHIKGLKDLGVDLEKIAKEAQKAGTKSKNMDDILK